MVLSLLGPADVLAGTGVDTDLITDVDEQGHLHLSAGLHGGGLEGVGGGVAGQTGLGLGDLQIHEVGALQAKDAALIAQHLADGVLGDEAEGIAQNILVQGDHVIGLLIHEVVQVAVVVAVSHVLALHEGLLELSSRVEGSLGDGAGHHVLHLGADKGSALAGLDVLELHVMILPSYSKVLPFLKSPAVIVAIVVSSHIMRKSPSVGAFPRIHELAQQLYFT